MSLNGYEIQVDLNLTESESKEVCRTWRERLFSFTPFKKTKTIVKYIPSTKILVYGNKLIMHPITRDAIVKAMDKKNGL